jgi:glyoxylase I family protein
MVFSHVGLTCKNPQVVERFYTRYFGFKRARVIPLGDWELVFIKSGDMYLELFKTGETSPFASAEKDGYPFPGFRHIAFQVEDVDAKLLEMGDDARITLGPLDFNDFIPGWRTVWVSDPEGNIVEITQGYRDQDNPPALD